MSNSLIDIWLVNIKKVKYYIQDYIKSIEIHITGDIESLKEALSIQKKLDKSIKILNKTEYSFNNTQEILENIFDINLITSYVVSLSKIISNIDYLKKIEREMSNTYYKELIKDKEKLSELISICKDNIIKITNSVADNISSEIILKTDIKQFETLYNKNICNTSTIIFNKYINTYKKNNINISTILQKIYDNILGYKGEKISKHPFSTHPILLMGLTFNLNHDNTFNSHKNINLENIIAINNKLKFSNYETFYNLKSLLDGKYLSIIKRHSINENTIEYSNTIHNNIIENKEIIKPSILIGEKKSEIYESLDGGNNYRKILFDIPINNYLNIKLGPKPRVFLYNDKFTKIIKDKDEIKIKKTIPNQVSNYIDVPNLIKLDDIDNIYKNIVTKKTNNREEFLYNIYKSDTFLKEIRKLPKVSEPKIPFTESTIINLF